MVEQNTVNSIHAVAFPVVLHNPERIEFGTRIRATRIEWGFLVLRHLLHLAIEFRCACLINAGAFFHLQYAHSLEQAQSAHCIGFGRVLRHIKRHFHMALGRKIIYFGRLDLLDDSNE